MLTVHHLGISQSDRIVWLCEELDVPFTLDKHDRDPVTRMAPESYRALHPSGTAPVITDGNLVLGESAAIVEYIIHRHGGGRLTVPPEADNYSDYLYWFHFANGSFMPAVMMELIASYIPKKPDAPAGTPSRLERAYAAVEARLGESEYLAGPVFTAADILTMFPLTTMRLFAPRDLSHYPNIRRYIAQIGQRPAFVRAMEKGDPGLAIPLT